MRDTGRRSWSRMRTDPIVGASPLGPRGVRSELVGRDAALARMSELVAHAVNFQSPQLITVVGNQGTGKTRLVVELVSKHLGSTMRVYHGHAAPSGARLHAIISLLRNRFGITEGDGSSDSCARFEAEIKRVFGDERVAEVLHFLGTLLDLPFPDSPFLRVIRDSGSQRDEIARAVLCRFIENDAKKSPMALVFDDVQWADDDTLRFLRELGTGLGGSSVVIIACTRPDMLVRCPDWGMGSIEHERIDLRNLDQGAAESMFKNLLVRCDNVPGDVVDDAVEMTGGNPHFLEQLVRLFLANGTIDAGGAVWHLDPERAAQTELPISIEEAIEARIAALAAEERDLLEKGAVFGNVFWVSAIVALTRIEATSGAHREPRAGGAASSRPLSSGMPADSAHYAWTSSDDPARKHISALLEELVERDYLLQLDVEDSTIPGEVELVFKHNLERELIVNSTDPERLARYHRLAAQWLETKLAGRSEEQLEFLAQLYERGGDPSRAAHCYLAGGDKARARYANQEAVELYTRGLAMLDDYDALARNAALHNLGDVLELVGRTAEALVHFSKMLYLAWLFDDQSKAGAANGRIGRIYRRRGDYDLAMEHLRDANGLFSRAGDERGIAATLDDMGQVHWLRGAYSQALELHRQALGIRRRLGDTRSIALSLANIGRVHRDSGGFKAAIAHFREALELRRAISDLPGVVQSLGDLGGVHTLEGGYDAALELFSEAYSIAVDTVDKLSQADVLARLGECKSAMGHGLEAVQHLRTAVELSTNLGDRVTLAECSWRLAEVYLAMGNPETAYDDASRALHISEAVGSRVHMGNAHRVLAEAIMARGFSPELEHLAEDHFQHALEILAGMHNELELMRVYRSFAMLRDRASRFEDAAHLRRLADDIHARLRGAAGTAAGIE